MTTSFRNSNRETPRLNNSVTKSQRNICQVVFSRWENPAKATLEFANFMTPGQLAGVDTNGQLAGGAASNKGNLNTQEIITVDNDIIRCEVTNNKGTSGGTFMITLKKGLADNTATSPGKGSINYLELLHPGDWAFIYMKKSGEVKQSNDANSGLKMVGIIENVRFVEVEDAKGSPRLEFIITGKSFGKILDMSIYFNPVQASTQIQTALGAQFLSQNTSAVAAAKKADPATTGDAGFFTPNAFVKALLNFMYGGALDRASRANELWHVPDYVNQFFKPNGKSKSKPSFIDFLDQSRIGLHNYTKGKLTGVTALQGKAIVTTLPSSGTVWDVINFLSNLGINELYVDLINKDGKLVPAMVLRQLPFSNKPTDTINPYSLAGKKTPGNVTNSNKTYFYDLPRHVISSSDVKQKNVGKSDFERINHIIVVPRSNAVTNTDLLYASSLNIASIQRYGLKSFQVQTPYIFSSSTDFKKFCEQCVNLLTDWFFMNHMFFNGTIITSGADDFVELGTNLYIDDVKQLFHIEGYTHTYEVDTDSGMSKYNTEFRVSRGVKLSKSETSLEFIGQVTDDTSIATSVLQNTRLSTSSTGTSGAKTANTLGSPKIPKLG